MRIITKKINMFYNTEIVCCFNKINLISFIGKHRE